MSDVNQGTVTVDFSKLDDVRKFGVVVPLTFDAGRRLVGEMAQTEMPPLDVGMYGVVSRYEATLVQKDQRIAALEAENENLRKRTILPEAPGNHDYNGPTKDGKAVTDPAHERFHGAIGDVLAGNIIPSARKQMREALDSVPKEKAPIRTVTNAGDPRRVGW